MLFLFIRNITTTVYPIVMDSSNENYQVAEHSPVAYCQESTWIHQNVLMFLEECQKRKEEISNPEIGRRALFQKIQKALYVKGVRFRRKSLEVKLRNLKLSYFNIFENILKNNGLRKYRLKWPYYDHLHDIFGDEARWKQNRKSSSFSSTAELETINANTLNYTSSLLINAKHNLVDDSSYVVTKTECNQIPMALSASTPDENTFLDDNCYFDVNAEGKNIISIEPTLNESTQPCRSGTFEEKLLAIEEEKLAVAMDCLQEIKKMRLLKQQQIDFIKKKYKNKQKRNGGDVAGASISIT